MKFRKSGSFIFMVVIFILCMALSGFSGVAGAASAGTVTLAWDANTESDLAGYKLYYDTAVAREPYDGEGADQGKSPIELPLAALTTAAAPQYTLTGLSQKTYFFAVTAYNTDGLESGYSNEVRANLKPPVAPSGLRRIIDMIVGFLKRLTRFA